MNARLPSSALIMATALAAALILQGLPPACAAAPEKAVAKKAAGAPAPDLSPEAVEKAILRGLDSLENSQRPGGFWENQNRSDRVDHTAWAILAFVANGHTPRSGPYRQTVEKALVWFMNEIKDYPDALTMQSGDDRRQDQSKQARAIFTAMSAIGSGTAAVPDEDLVVFAERAVRQIVSIQYKREEGARGSSLLQDFLAGGWGRIEESYWFTLCLLSARQNGIPVPPVALQDARDFWQRTYQPQFGSFFNVTDFGKSQGQNQGPTYSPRALPALVLLGTDPDDPMIRNALALLMTCKVSDPAWYFHSSWFHESGGINRDTRARWDGHSRLLGDWYLCQKLCGVKGEALEAARLTFSAQILRNQMDTGAFRLVGWDQDFGSNAYGTPAWTSLISPHTADWGEPMITARALYALAYPKGYIAVFIPSKVRNSVRSMETGSR